MLLSPPAFAFRLGGCPQGHLLPNLGPLRGRSSAELDGAHEHSVTVGLRGRPSGAVPVRNNLVVPGDPLPNRTGPFPSIRLSSDYCVGVAVGCPSWIAVWQVAQTTNVFLRLLAIS
jgi:hypothetical protein